MRPATIMIATSDTSFRELLYDAIYSEGWNPIIALNEIDILAMAQKEQLDMVVLSTPLPDADSVKIMQTLRQHYNIAIIVISNQNDLEDKVWYFKLGADDYLVKPFVLDELVSRMHAVLRRMHKIHSDILSIGNMNIDIYHKRVFINEKEIVLTKLEFDLLTELALNAGNIVLSQQLLVKIWGPEFSNETSLLYTHIKNLRRKINLVSQNFQYIKCKSKIGYQLQLPSNLSR